MTEGKEPTLVERFFFTSSILKISRDKLLTLWQTQGIIKYQLGETKGIIIMSNNSRGKCKRSQNMKEPTALMLWSEVFICSRREIIILTVDC